MKTKVRMKLLALMATSLFPILYILVYGRTNILLIAIAVLLSLIIVWIVGDYVLVDSYIQLKESNTLKSKYIFIASHDLRTPMTAIKGLVSMVADGDYGPINKDLEEPLLDIKASTERLIHLMNDLLTLSRVGDARLTFNKEDVDVKKQVDEVVNLLLPIAKQKNIMIDSAHCSALLAQADSEKLNQILYTLIHYILMFTHERQIYISSQRMDTCVSVCIADMDKDMTGLLKEKNDSLPDGAGLDYYIAREFTKKMGEEVQFHTSKDRKKIAFIFSLPLFCRDGET